jgi:trk system potassium uptake protein TrkH
MHKPICQLLGTYLLYFSLLLLLPLGYAAYCQFALDPTFHPQPHSTDAFAAALLIGVGGALILKRVGGSAPAPLYRRESILLVALVWVATAAIAALPFWISNTLAHPADAYFEAISGLTTTGASTMAPKAYNPATGEEVPIYLTNPHVPDTTYVFYGTISPVRDPSTGAILYSGVEAVGKALLFWRSFLQWIGGLGIVVIFLTVLPALGVGGKFLYQMEMSGPVKEGIAPRVRDTASKLWKLYLLLTVLEIGLLIATNREMPLFDAVCTSLSTISTGGFSVRNGSIGSYGHPATEAIVILFMVLGSINFACYFHALRRQFARILAPDFFLFFSVLLIGVLAVSLYLVGHRGAAGVYSWPQALKDGLFQAISFQTSTGFFTTNYDRWPFPSQMFLLLLMFVGGMSGSTAGGIKTSRFYILYKIVAHRLELLFRPDSIRLLRVGSMEIDDRNALTVLAFFCIVAFFTVLSTTVFVLDQVDPETALGLSACFFNNVGLAFRAAGPLDSCAFLSTPSKLLASFWMLLGRLEYFVLILLFLPSYWKNR